MAVRFDAANDRYTASTGLPTGNTWTVTNWIYISVDRNAYSTWLSIDDANTGTRRFAFLNTVSNGTTLALDTQGSSVGSYAGAVGVWYRYGVSVNSGAVSLYIGTATGSLTTYTGAPSNFPTAPVRLWIGNEPIFGDFFNGRVAAVKIWNAALSAAEVEAELAQYAPVRTADLLRYHPFIDSPADESGNGHTLTAGSSPVTWETGPDIPEGGEPDPIEIDVDAARAACRATRPTLTQDAPVVQVRAARAASRATRPLLEAPFIRPFFQAADWLWGEIPASPDLDPQSTQIASALASGQHVANTVDFSVALAGPDGITGSTPRYDVFFVNQTGNGGDNWGTDPFGSQTMPIPPGLVVPGAYSDWPDGHVAVADPTTNTTFNLWQAEDRGTSWRASWGAMAPFDGDGREYTYSSTGAGLARFACVIRVDDIARGVINHALFFSTDIARPTEYRYPATKTDGSNGAGSPVTIPEGARVQLDPNINLDTIPGITPAEVTIGRALQKYGAYCGDNGGARMAFIFERATDTDDANGIPGQTYVDAGLSWDYIDMTHIPWGSLRVLESWDGGVAPALVVQVHAATAATRATRPTLAHVTTLIVDSVRSGSTTTRPTVTQNGVLQVQGARSTSSAPHPTLTHTTTLPVRAARSAATTTTPLLGSVTAVTVDDTRATTTATVAEITHTSPLTVDPARATTTTGAVTVDQRSVLAVDDARAATAASTPLLVAPTVLTARDTRAATTVTAPSLAQNTGLHVDEARTATTAGAAPLEQNSALDVDDARSVTDATRPVLISDSSLVIGDARAATTVTAPLLAAPAVVAVRDARSAATATAPRIEQTGTVLVPAARAETAADTPTLTVSNVLPVRDAQSATAVTAPLLVQQTTLEVLSVRAATTAQQLLMGVTPGVPVRGPTSVLVADHAVTALHTPTAARAAHDPTRSTVLVPEQAGVVRSEPTETRADVDPMTTTAVVDQARGVVLISS